MSDPNEPTGPEGSADQPAPTPPPSEQPPPSAPPPPPSSDLPPAPPPGDVYGGAAAGGDGGYGTPPPASPYGQPAPGGPPAGPYSAPDAVSYGWRKFFASPGTLLLPVLVVFVVLVVTEILLYVLLYNTLLGTHDCTQTIVGQEVQTQCGPSFILRLFVTALITGLITIAWSFAAAGLYKGALAVVDGKPFSMGAMFQGWDKGQVAIAAVLIGVATAIGSFLCYVPGLIVGFLMMFTLLFIVDKQMQAIDAIKASFKLVTDNLGQTIVWALLAIVVYVVGLVVCCVGLLVAIPIILIGLAYTYRRLQGEPVAV
jgi:uncharacterized membrane protein